MNLTLRRYTNKYINYAKNSFIYYHKVGTLKTVFRRPKAKGPINSPNHLQSINNKLARIMLHHKKTVFENAAGL